MQAVSAAGGAVRIMLKAAVGDRAAQMASCRCPPPTITSAQGAAREELERSLRESRPESQGRLIKEYFQAHRAVNYNSDDSVILRGEIEARCPQGL